VLLGGELPVGHEIGLIVVAAIFIAFALVVSFVVPRYKPDFPGPNGLSTFVIASIVMFGLMVAAVNFFG
jgi:Mg/Co/Ni transporter MgtE